MCPLYHLGKDLMIFTLHNSCFTEYATVLQPFCFITCSHFHLFVRDKAREKQRQKNLASKPPRQPRLPEPTRAPKKERKETADKRRLHQKIEDDEEMNREYRLLKKLKKGTLSEQEYDEEVTRMSDLQSVEPTRNVSEDVGDVDLSVQASESKVSKRSVQSNGKSKSKFKSRPAGRANKIR